MAHNGKPTHAHVWRASGPSAKTTGRLLHVLSHGVITVLYCLELCVCARAYKTSGDDGQYRRRPSLLSIDVALSLMSSLSRYNVDAVLITTVVSQRCSSLWRYNNATTTHRRRHCVVIPRHRRQRDVGGWRRWMLSVSSVVAAGLAKRRHHPPHCWVKSYFRWFKIKIKIMTVKLI